jgi:hypothetical protein
VAAWVPDMLCDFYRVKNKIKILITQTAIKAREKNKHRFGIPKY